MKKVNFFVVIGVVLVLVLAIVALCFMLKNGKKSNNNYELLMCSTATDIAEYIERNKIQSYNLNDEQCVINGVSLFDADVNVEFDLESESVTWIKIENALFQDTFENISDEELETFDIMQYQFSQEDKDNIESTFNEFKAAFEQHIDCTIEQYDWIPTQDGIAIENKDELFYQGLLIKEYSVRDRNNVLWLLRYQASYGMAHATLIKLVDETGFEGFIPVVDLTKS